MSVVVGLEEAMYGYGSELSGLMSLRRSGLVRVTGLKKNLTVNRNDLVKMTMTLESTYDRTVTKDLLSAYGTYDPRTKRFTLRWACIAEDVSIPRGTSSKSINCRAILVGTWDALAAVGTYDRTTREFKIEHAIVKQRVLTVKEKAMVKVKDFTLSKA